MSDRVAVINDGELEQVAPPKEVYENPASEFVSGFIGQPSTQFFDGHVTMKNGTAALDIDQFRFDLPFGSAELDGHADSDIRVGIRPQHIAVSDDPGEGIPATHILDEPLGDETHSFFDTEFGEVIVVTDPAFEGNEGEYSLVLDTDYVRLFDPVSGERVA